MIETRVSRFGNSRGVRIPRPLLQQAGIVDEVTIEVRDGEIVIRRREADPRAAWPEAFAAMAAAGSKITTNITRCQIF